MIPATCLFLILGACSDESPPDPSHVEGGPSGPVSDGSGGGGSSQEWDPRSWEPAERIERVSMTEAEREQFWEDWVARHSEQFGDDAPQVERVAWMDSSVAQGEMVAACMRESGFPEARADEGAIVLDNLPESQREAHNLAMFVCLSSYPVDPEISQDWNQAQIGLVYDYWDEYFIPCMDAHGYSIDTSARPSRESFVAEFHSGPREWWPAHRYGGLPEEDRAALAGVCPPLPSDDVLYGT